MLSFTEDTFEQAVIELFENMGYTYIYAPDMNRTDYSRPLLDDVLRDCLVRLNRSLPAVAIDEAYYFSLPYLGMQARNVHCHCAIANESFCRIYYQLFR